MDCSKSILVDDLLAPLHLVDDFGWYIMSFGSMNRGSDDNLHLAYVILVEHAACPTRIDVSCTLAQVEEPIVFDNDPEQKVFILVSRLPQKGILFQEQSRGGLE